MKRRKMSPKTARKVFKRGDRTKTVNLKATPMRGGFRM